MDGATEPVGFDSFLHFGLRGKGQYWLAIGREHTFTEDGWEADSVIKSSKLQSQITDGGRV